MNTDPRIDPERTPAAKSKPWLKADFSFFETITLRWADNDAYGHINNAHYYSFFDTAVDAFFCPVAFRVQTYGLPLSPECMAYVQTLLTLPAMQAWYVAALKEAWIDPSHDAEVLALGRLLQDLRAP